MKLKKPKNSPIHRRIQTLCDIADELYEWQFDDTSAVQQFLFREVANLIRGSARMLSMVVILEGKDGTG